MKIAVINMAEELEAIISVVIHPLNDLELFYQVSIKTSILVPVFGACKVIDLSILDGQENGSEAMVATPVTIATRKLLWLKKR